MRKMAAFFGVFLLSSVIAWAGGPCKKDMEALCPDAQGDREKVAQCVKANAEKFSPDCKAHKAKMKEMLQTVHAACEQDVEALCADVEPGEKRIMKCLRKNKKKVSEACRAAFEDMKEKRKEMKKKSSS
jgi:hypothetical protein